MVRRWVWVFLRVEWECVKKVEGESAEERGVERLEMGTVVFDEGDVEKEKTGPVGGTMHNNYVH